jgi:hypothetical protein
MEGLRGITWNSEGFRDPGKHLFVKESIREYRLDFVALLENGRSNFTVPFLRDLSGDRDFNWYCLPPHGRSGGILVGINANTLEVKKVEIGDFCVKLSIKSKSNIFEWVLVPVYGAEHDSLKHEFLSELVKLCEAETLPLLWLAILIFYASQRRKVIIILTLVGLSFLMRLLRALTLERLLFRVVILRGQAGGKIRRLKN